MLLKILVHLNNCVNLFPSQANKTSRHSERTGHAPTYGDEWATCLIQRFFYLGNSSVLSTA